MRSPSPHCEGRARVAALSASTIDEGVAHVGRSLPFTLVDI
ncbi:MAG: hypothetical protein RI900_2370, partial [Actinomycetota bacterium]